MFWRTCVVVCSGLLVAATTGASAQDSAHIELSSGRVTAGDTITAKLSFDPPAPCDDQLELFFFQSNGGASFLLATQVLKGTSAVTVSGQVPMDQAGGDYTRAAAQFNPCPGYSKPSRIEIADIKLTVLPNSAQIQYPTTAKLELSFNQRQFLDTKAAQLSELDGRLNDRFEQGHADVPGLRQFLSDVVRSAEDDLTLTEKQYRQIMKSQENLPAFFADFHARYHDLLINLNAPIPGLGYQEPAKGPRLIYAQLKQRTPDNKAADTLPPVAEVVWQAIKDNKALYVFIRDNGRITFTARLRSFPPGAIISYRKEIDDQFQDYSSPTDVEKATFELARWVFKFHKDGCKGDQIRRIDPYQDSDPDISVEFSHCGGR